MTFAPTTQAASSAPTASSFADYKAIPAINWSTLKHALTSPLAYQCALVSERDSAAMRVGRAFHAMLPTLDGFAESHAVYSGVRRGAEWERFERQHGHLEIITTSERDQAKAMADAVRMHPRAQFWIEDTEKGSRELTLRWVDEITGLDCKGRVDWLSGSGRLIEFKSTSTQTPRQFFAQAEQLGYIGQAAFYLDGLRRMGVEASPPVLIVVQSCEPHDVWCLPMSAETISQGRDLYCEALAIVQGCMQTKRWLGAAGDGDIPFQRASWMEQDEDDESNP